MSVNTTPELDLADLQRAHELVSRARDILQLACIDAEGDWADDVDDIAGDLILVEGRLEHLMR